jgi:hypothetical protein
MPHRKSSVSKPSSSFCFSIAAENWETAIFFKFDVYSVKRDESFCYLEMQEVRDCMCKLFCAIWSNCRSKKTTKEMDRFRRIPLRWGQILIKLRRVQGNDTCSSKLQIKSPQTTSFPRFTGHWERYCPIKRSAATLLVKYLQLGTWRDHRVLKIGHRKQLT